MTIVSSESYNRVPVGRTVVRGTPVIRQEKKLTTAAKAGMLMQIDGTDYKCRTYTGESELPIGWLAYEECPAAISRPDNIDDDMQIGDVVGIVGGGGIEVVAWAVGDTAQDIDIKSGDYLTNSGTSVGTLTKWTSSSQTRAFAIAAESISIPHGTPVQKVKIHVKSLI